MSGLRTLTKLLLVPFLIAYLLVLTKGKPNILVITGLMLSFIGDLLLTRTGELFFLLGMLAFVGTHVCNSIFFIQLQKGNGQKGKAVTAAIVLLTLLSAFVFWQLRPYLGSFQVPILVYMFIISTMTVLATGVLDNGMLKRIALQYFIPGAALFVLSDAALAMNKFLLHRPLIDIFVMLTYGAAQYFLVMGFSKVLPLRQGSSSR